MCPILSVLRPHDVQTCKTLCSLFQTADLRTLWIHMCIYYVGLEGSIFGPSFSFVFSASSFIGFSETWREQYGRDIFRVLSLKASHYVISVSLYLVSYASGRYFFLIAEQVIYIWEKQNTINGHFIIKYLLENFVIICLLFVSLLVFLIAVFSCYLEPWAI